MSVPRQQSWAGPGVGPRVDHDCVKKTGVCRAVDTKSGGRAGLGDCGGGAGTHG